jgi:hypothetical protein
VLIDVPSIVITMKPDACELLRRQLRDLVPRLHCLRATRRADVRMGPENGTASLPLALENGEVAAGRILFHHPPVHPTIFSVGALECAILVSHLRALRMGLRKGHGSPFLVFEEDAEWAMLLASPHRAVTTLLARMPRHWSVLQAAIIAEPPYMRHLQARLSRTATRHRAHRRSDSPAPPIVPRATLRGLSWPFTPSREVIGLRLDWHPPGPMASRPACLT